MQDLPFNTATQFLALALTLLAGWLFGLASARPGRRWRERYQDRDLELTTLRDRSKQDLRIANERIRELEAENARLRAGAPATVVERPGLERPVAGATTPADVTAASAARPADRYR